MARGTTYAEELAGLLAAGEWDATPFMGKFAVDPEGEEGLETIKVENGYVTVRYHRGVPGWPGEVNFVEIAKIPLIDPDPEREDDDEDPRDGDPKYWIELRDERND